MKFGEKLRSLREKAGLSVRQVAAKLNKSPGYISRVEVKGEIPSPEFICNFSALLVCDPEALLNMAKSEQLKKAASQIDARHSDALKLYRRSRK